MHALQEDGPCELEVRHHATGGDERARLLEREPRLEVVVADEASELERELADELVEPGQIGGDLTVLDRVAHVRDQQDADVLQVVALAAPVHVDEVHAVGIEVVDDVVGVEVAVQAHRHWRRQRRFEVGRAMKQVGQRAMGDAEDPALAAAQRLELGMEGVEVGQPVPDLPRVVDPRRLLHERGPPDVADGLEEPARGADFLGPAAGDIDVAQHASPKKLPQEREPPVLSMTRLDVGDEAGNDQVPRVHLPDLLVDLSLVTFLPDQRLARTDRDAPDARAADPTPDLPEVELALGVRDDRARDLLEVEILMQLEPLAGQDEEGRLADVQDRVADTLQELRHEEVRDDEGRIRMGLGKTPECLLQRVAILLVEVELAAAGVLGLLGSRVGERRDDLVEGGQRHARRAGQVERDRAGGETRHVHRLLGDVDRVVAELFEVERHPEDSAKLARAHVARRRLGDALETLHLDETEQVVDLIVLLGDLLGEPRVSLEERGHAPDELRLDQSRHHGKVLTEVLVQDASHGSLSDPGSVAGGAGSDLRAGRALPDGHAQLGRLRRRRALPADLDLDAPLVLLLARLQLELDVAGGRQVEGALAGLEADLTALEPDGERREVLRDLLRRRDPGELHTVLSHREPLSA